MSEGLICPTCTIKLGDMGELAAHVKECGSLASGAKQSALVKSQQRVWQDACTQLHQGLISYDNYARVLGPKMYTRRHWVCQDMSGGKKVSKVSVRAEPSDSSAKFRVLKEGEILFEIDNAYKERRVWIKFFDIERNCLAWFATTSRSGRTVRASEIRHPKPEGYVHPASQGNTPMLKSKRIVQEAAPASAPAPVPAPQLVVPPGELYKPGLDSESDEGDAMVDIRAQAMARLRRQRNASSVNVAVTGDIAVRSAEEVDGADCTSDDDHTTDGVRILCIIATGFSLVATAPATFSMRAQARYTVIAPVTALADALKYLRWCAPCTGKTGICLWPSIWSANPKADPASSSV